MRVAVGLKNIGNTFRKEPFRSVSRNRDAWEQLPSDSARRPLLLWEEQGLALVSACQCMSLPSVWDFLPVLGRVSILSIRWMVTGDW